jgi:hypothetical protein
MDSGMIRLTMLPGGQSNAILRIQIFINKKCVIQLSLQKIKTSNP